MSDEIEVLKLVTTRLDAAGIGYMVTGSLALSHYAQPRMTRDIDLVVALEPNDAERLAHLLGDQFDCDADAIRAAIVRQDMFNLIHTELVVKVDFVVRKDIPFRLEEFARRRCVEFAGERISIVTPEDLLLSKLVWAKDTRSPIQLADARNLIESTMLDWTYAERWAAHLSVAELPARGTNMNDTAPEVAERYRTLIMRRSGGDRLRMACEMFDCARQLMLARIKAEQPDLTASELRVKIFECTYGREFEPGERARIIARLRSRGAQADARRS